MRKIVFTLICLVGFISIYNAECTYKEQKELNVLANYVEYNYVYDEVNGNFNLNFVNVPNELFVQIDGKNYYPENGTVLVGGFSYGQEIEITIRSSQEAECYNEYLRVNKFSFPYLNEYFGSADCVGHENLNVCNHRFLNYRITKNTFYKMISEDIENVTKNEEEDIKDVKVSFWVSLWKYVKKFSIPVVLVLVTSFITFSICNIIFRKIKHGL